MSKLILEKESYRIRGAAFEVYKEMVSIEQPSEGEPAAAGILQPRKTQNDTEIGSMNKTVFREFPCVPWFEGDAP